MHVSPLIEKKRDGHALTAKEINSLMEDFTVGEIPDYQMSAWAMAVLFRGMTPAETRHLTDSMMRSGRILKYPDGSPPKIDKQSTGGVGDKVSLVLAPLLACDEVWVPMISSRGTGITGGTLDKLESIPGFNVNLDEKRALKQLDKIGVFMIGETEDICPADKKLYALRDETGTVRWQRAAPSDQVDYRPGRESFRNSESAVGKTSPGWKRLEEICFFGLRARRRRDYGGKNSRTTSCANHSALARQICWRRQEDGRRA